MWIGGMFVWIMMMAFTFFLGWAERHYSLELKCLVAHFSGCFAPYIMGVHLPEDYMAIYGFGGFDTLMCVVGVSICFFGWKTRYAELFAGLFFVLSIATWLVSGFSFIYARL